MSHPAATAPDPRDEDLPLPLLPADMPPVARPEHHRRRARRALRPRHPDRPSHQRVRTGRQRARPYHGHGESPPQIPSRDRTANPGEEGSLHQVTDPPQSWTAPGYPAARITKERSRTPAADAQPIMPETTAAACS